MNAQRPYCFRPITYHTGPTSSPGRPQLRNRRGVPRLSILDGLVAATMLICTIWYLQQWAKSTGWFGMSNDANRGYKKGTSTLLWWIGLDTKIKMLPKIEVPYIYDICAWSPQIQPAGYHISSWSIYVFWSLYYIYQLLKKKHTIATTAKITALKWYHLIPTTHLLRV